MIGENDLKVVADTYDFLYKKSLPELKKDYTDSLIFNAIRVWKNKGISADEISDKIDNLKETLARAGKEQFIAIYKQYKKDTNKQALYFPKYEIQMIPELPVKEQGVAIDKAIDKGEYLYSLYDSVGDKLTPEQIDKAIDKGENLRYLYQYAGKNFTSQQTDKAIDKGEYLWYLYKYVGDKLTQIDKAIDKGKYLWYLYKYVGKYFTPEQIDKAIDKGKYLGTLYASVGDKLTPEQKKRYEEKIKKKSKTSSESIMLIPMRDLETFVDFKYPDRHRKVPKGHRPFMRNEEEPVREQKEVLPQEEHDMFFGPSFPQNVRQYCKMDDIFKTAKIEQYFDEEEQLKKQSNNKQALYFPKYEIKMIPELPEEEQEEAIDKAIEKGVYLYLLYTYVGENFTPQNIDKAIEKGEYLNYLYGYAGENFTPQQIDKAIEKGEYLDYLYKYVGKYFTPQQNKRYKEKIKKKASILDYPKLGLDLSIWTEEGALKEDIKNVILHKLTQFFDSKGIKLTEVVDDIVIIGSLTTYQYNSKSDLDVHSIMNYDKFKEQLFETGLELSKKQIIELLDKTWRKELGKACKKAPNTEHPIECYFELDEELSAKKEDGIYSILKDEWLQAPRTVDLDYDIAKLYPDIVEYAEEIASEIDIELGEIKRDITNIEFLQETITQLDGGKKKLFKEKLENKIQEIEDSILDLVETGKTVIDKRKKKEYEPESGTNINFKYLQRYGYLWLVKQLGEALEDKTTEKIEIEDMEDVDTVEEIIDTFETEPKLCEEIKARKHALYFLEYEIKMIPELPEEEQEEAIDKAINKGKDLRTLYVSVGKNFTPQNIDKAIEKGEDLGTLYESVGDKLTPEQINKAIDKGEEIDYWRGELWYLYKYVGKYFTPEQIDKAIDKGEDLGTLYEHAGKNFTPEQKKKYEEKIKKKGNVIESIGFNKQGDYTRYFYDNVGQIIGRIEVGEDGNAFAYDTFGNLVGKSWEGKTFNAQGDIVAQSDILPSLLVREERVTAINYPQLKQGNKGGLLCK